MKATTRVVVIGGGIGGCSALYHLTREGWTDVVLVERDELTSGSTLHSVAQVTNFGLNQTMIGLKSHSIALYSELAADPHYPINYHHADGGIRLANTEFQMEAYRHFASMAIESMRMEKGYLHWKADLITEFNPFESGLGRFVQMDKDFIGRTRLQQMITAGPRKLLVSLDIACDHAPGHPGASVCADGDVVGTVTSAAWGHSVGKNLAYAFVDPAAAHIGDELTVDVLGLPVKATVIDPCPYDPVGDRVQGGQPPRLGNGLHSLMK